MKHLLVCLLVVLLGRLPIPWAHSHETLLADPLQEHLASYHQGEQDGLPLGGTWHLHLFCFGSPAATPDGFTAGTFPDQPSQLDTPPYRLASDEQAAQRRLRDTWQQPATAMLPTVMDSTPAARGSVAVDNNAAPVRADCSLFHLHCALLA